MRTIRHVTPRYVLDRAREWQRGRTHPEDPWLTPQSVEILATMLRPTDVGLEFGSGRSTLWFASRVAELTSVEHDEAWYLKVCFTLQQRGLRNVEACFAPRDVPEDQGAGSEYVGLTSRIPDDSLDFAMVDGAYRDSCAKAVLPKLRSGGILVLDNVNWFLPSHSRAPASRTPEQGPDGPVWSEVWHTLQGWRMIWTGSGVWDTALFFKP